MKFGLTLPNRGVLFGVTTDTVKQWLGEAARGVMFVLLS